MQIEQIVRVIDDAEADRQVSEAKTSSVAEMHAREGQALRDSTSVSKAAPARKPCTSCCDNTCFRCRIGKVFNFESLFGEDEEEEDYEATCVEKTKDIIGAAGASCDVACTFKNSGHKAWPSNVHLKLINGSNSAYKSLGLEQQSVKPSEELSFSFNVKLPDIAGKKNLTLMLVHGEDHVEFGDIVTVCLQVESQVEPHETSGPADTAQQRDQIESPLNETSGDNFEVGQEDLELEAENPNDISGDSWTCVDEIRDEPISTPQPERTYEKTKQEEDLKQITVSVGKAAMTGKAQDLEACSSPPPPDVGPDENQGKTGRMMTETQKDFFN